MSGQKEVKVKHIIEYLQQFNQEAEIALDKEGWDGGETELEMIQYSGLFSGRKDGDYVVINN